MKRKTIIILCLVAFAWPTWAAAYTTQTGQDITLPKDVTLPAPGSLALVGITAVEHKRHGQGVVKIYLDVETGLVYVEIIFGDVLAMVALLTLIGTPVYILDDTGFRAGGKPSGIFQHRGELLIKPMERRI